MVLTTHIQAITWIRKDKAAIPRIYGNDEASAPSLSNLLTAKANGATDHVHDRGLTCDRFDGGYGGLQSWRDGVDHRGRPSGYRGHY